MRWLDFGARNRLSDKGCHPFYEFPYDTAKICSFSLFAKQVLSNIKKLYQHGYSILNSAILHNVSLYFHGHRFLHSLRSVEMTRVHPIRTTTASFPSTVHHCHLERPHGVERSKSCKYNKYPGPYPRKRPIITSY